MRFFLLLAFIIFANASADAASTEARCRSYAGGAVVSARRNIALKCGFAGDRWVDNEENHRGWCLTVRQSTQENEDRIRNKMLKDCRHRVSGGPPVIVLPPATKFCAANCTACARDRLSCRQRSILDQVCEQQSVFLAPMRHLGSAVFRCWPSVTVPPLGSNLGRSHGYSGRRPVS